MEVYIEAIQNNFFSMKLKKLMFSRAVAQIAKKNFAGKNKKNMAPTINF
jgi:hypothetical protein